MVMAERPELVREPVRARRCRPIRPRSRRRFARAPRRSSRPADRAPTSAGRRTPPPRKAAPRSRRWARSSPTPCSRRCRSGAMSARHEAGPLAGAAPSSPAAAAASAPPSRTRWPAPAPRVVVAARTATRSKPSPPSCARRARRRGPCACDVTDEAQVRALARRGARARSASRRAGQQRRRPRRRRRSSEITLAEWNRDARRPTPPARSCARASSCPAMVERGWGRIVNVASTRGLEGGTLHRALQPPPSTRSSASRAPPALELGRHRRHGQRACARATSTRR